jgi:hypothetical protein
MFLEATSIDSAESAIDTVDTEVAGAEPDNGAVLDMGGVGRSIGSCVEADPENPERGERDGPVCGGDGAEWVEE